MYRQWNIRENILRASVNITNAKVIFSESWKNMVSQMVIKNLNKKY